MVKDVLILVLWISKEAMMNLDEKEQIGNDPEDKTTQSYNKNEYWILNCLFKKNCFNGKRCFNSLIMDMERRNAEFR